MRILALVPGGIGDQVLFFPTLATLKQTYPNAQIDVVVEPRSQGAYRVCNTVSTVIPFNFRDRNSLADWGNLLGMLRDRRYDVAMSLGKSWGVAVLLWMTGTPIRVGYASRSAMFLTNPVPLNPDQYAACMYHDLLQGLGITKPCPPLTISIPKVDLDWAEQEQKRLELPTTGYVIIHGGSSRVAKEKGIIRTYPVEGWQRVISDFQAKQPTLPIVLIQGPDDAEFISAMVEKFPTLKTTAPDNIGQLAAMIAGANLMLCTDSAPMHLAVAVQTYVLGLFGPTNPAKSLPQSDKVAAVVSPTGNVADIDPEAILAKVWGQT